MTETTAVVHVSKVGTYHPACGNDCRSGVDCGTAAWTINDTRGYMDGGPSCDTCGACECDAGMGPCPVCGEIVTSPSETADGRNIYSCGDASRVLLCHGEQCIGLSFVFVCLDGGESLCEECAEKEGITIVDCDCA